MAAKLRKELAEHLHKGGSFPMLRHPLVFSVPYNSHPVMVKMLNEMYAHKTAALEKAIEERNAHRAIFLHERPFRLQAFLDMMDAGLLPEGTVDYWECLHAIWVDSESPYVNNAVWEMLFSAKNSRYFMSEEDAATLDYLFTDRKTLKVWRGAAHDGLSYTTNYEKAQWFAKRWNGAGKIFTRDVRREDIVGYTDARGEREIVLKQVPKE